MSLPLSNPFPGVDPFIESQGLWPDFHASFITYLRDALTEALPDHYEARINERVNLVERAGIDDAITKRVGPDIAVSEREQSVSRWQPGAGLATLEPVTIPLLIEEVERETFIQILHREDQALVAVVEVLSPANKEMPGHGEYLAKRYALLRQHVHLVEIDLLLRGTRPPLLRELPPGDFFALVSRADRRPNCDVYAWSLAEALPRIPIPLKGPDPDLVADLSAVFQLTYQRGRYRRTLRYEELPRAIENNDRLREWVQSQLQSARNAS
jgi:hypothetical protein